MIFKANWQLLLKWHSLHGFLPKSEQAQTLTPAQGGGHKGCSAIDQATQQVIEKETIQLNQHTAINLFLDACHCFDLMVDVCHSMACHHGAAEDYLCIHAQTHCLMRYYVWHKYGVSEDYNTFAHSPSWHGVGQGAADAELQYIVLSDTLIDAYHSYYQP